MSRNESIFPLVPRDAKKRRAWVKYVLHCEGRSLAQIAAEKGVGRTAVYSAFNRPYPRMELAIAEAVGMTPQALFPERYNEDGLPNRRPGRPGINPDIKDTTKDATHAGAHAPFPASHG